MIKLEAESMRIDTDGFLPVIVARADEIEIRIPIDLIRARQITAAFNHQAQKIRKLTRK
jgi:hypothetical protein